MNRKQRLWYIKIITFIVGMGIAGLLVTFTSCSSKEDENKEYNVVQVVRRDIGNEIQATGIVKPRIGSDVIVGTRTSGLIKDVYAKIGDKVSKNQLIAKLEDSELKSKLEQAVALYEKEKADYDYSKLEYERQKDLASSGLVSQSKIDEFKKEHDINLALLKQAKANINYAKVQLSYTDVYAPIDGTITDILKNTGEIIIISSSSPGLFRIIDLDNLEVNTYVDEIDISKINVGNRVVFTVDAFPYIEFPGEVKEILPNAVIIDNVVNYIIVVTIHKNEEQVVLRPEMTANVTVVLDVKEDVLSVPIKAVSRKLGKKYVTIVTNDEFETREVRTGWKNDRFTEIINGVKEGEKIVIYR
jgi:macrolide-specific efflux system membrane fusion protein